jgi:hypothetical protein
MDPHTYAPSPGVYGAMSFPAIDDWEMVQNEVSRSPVGSYVLYRSTEANQQQPDVSHQDIAKYFEVEMRFLIYHFPPFDD